MRLKIGATIITWLATAKTNSARVKRIRWGFPVGGRRAGFVGCIFKTVGFSVLFDRSVVAC